MQQCPKACVRPKPDFLVFVEKTYGHHDNYLQICHVRIDLRLFGKLFGSDDQETEGVRFFRG